MHKIMIIEDSKSIRDELSTLLNRYGYEVAAIESFDDILVDVENIKPHLILLDINLPKYDGYYICKNLRKSYDIPIIMVTCRDSDLDELMSMNLGADDFITKPYNIQILLARISAVLKRVYSNTEDTELLVYKDIKFNVSKGYLEYGERYVELTKNEIKILYILIQKSGHIVSREEMMNYLWSSDIYVDDNTLSVNISRLRNKISSLGLCDYIETRRGLGYTLR